MVNVEAFKAHMAGGAGAKGYSKPAEGSAKEEAAESPKEEKEEDGLTPGHQLHKAIKAGDHAAMEEAVHRIVARHHSSKAGGY